MRFYHLPLAVLLSLLLPLLLSGSLNATITTLTCTGGGTVGISATAGTNTVCRSIIETNTVIDWGQFTSITINGIQGGNGPYTANFVYQLPTNIPQSNTILFTVTNGGTIATANEVELLISTSYPANQMQLAFNGVPQTVYDSVNTLIVDNAVSSGTLGANTLYGVFGINAVIFDNGANAISIISIQPLLIMPALSSVAITSIPATASTLDAGESVTFNAVNPSGGTAPYTYNFIIYNSATNIEVGNLITTHNGFVYNIPGDEAGNTLVANVFVTDHATTPETVNSVPSAQITVHGTLGISAYLSPQIPIVSDTSKFTVSIVPVHGTGPFTFNWFSGNVVGGFDQLQFSLIPPFGMPTPPPPNTLPQPMLKYQNPGNNVAVTPYIWNGIAFNSVVTTNAFAIPMGNESAIPVFVPNLFTVTSSLPNSLTLNLPTGAPTNALQASVVSSSQVIYNLDTYTLVQSNTLGVNTVFTNPLGSYIAITQAEHLIGINIIITNLGMSANYVTANTPQLFLSVSGFALNRTGSPKPVFAFVNTNSMPASGQSVSIFPQFGNQLLENVTDIRIMGPTPPSPGIAVSVYDTVNSETAVTDSAHNLLLATYSYNGPTILYHVPGHDWYGTVNALIANVVTYTGENSMPVNMILTANTALLSTIPSNAVPYFTFNVPEITAQGSTQPDSYVLLNITNATNVGIYPTYSFIQSFTPGSPPQFNVYYASPTGNIIQERPVNLTSRGSGFGPITPFAVSYYMAENIVTYNPVAFSTSNSVASSDLNLHTGPNLMKLSVSDSATLPVTFTQVAGGVVFPHMQLGSESITNSTLSVGGATSLVTITMKGGQPPFTGYWDMIPPSAGAVQSNSFVLTLPTNQITLLVNVISDNSILFTPQMGSNTSVGGGRNNSMLLYLTDHKAYLQFPSFGNGAPPAPLLLATGLTNSTVYGLWAANSTVNNTDPGAKFEIPAPTTTTAATTTTGGCSGICGSGSSAAGPGGGGGSPPPASSSFSSSEKSSNNTVTFDNHTITINNTGNGQISVVGYHMYNMTRDATQTITINKKLVTITINFITPNSTGITVNGANYTLLKGQLISINDPIYIDFKQLTYTPILHAVNLDLFTVALAAPANTTTAPAANTTATSSNTSAANTIAPALTTAVTTTISAITTAVTKAANGVQASAFWTTAIAAAIIILVILYLLYRHLAVRGRRR